ncbi:hypothetical protein NDU88_005182 [Pleurodeles waltl]|uniref:Uncharacterized protein n=1 Tax=Pleurodeles waltl TaxID=8319 RepID=A0AAV7W744_PLEWA|nr:hypothetical protein NDU88_005182 [Pleurodeles waltl]
MRRTCAAARVRGSGAAYLNWNSDLRPTPTASWAVARPQKLTWGDPLGGASAHICAEAGACSFAACWPAPAGLAECAGAGRITVPCPTCLWTPDD